MIFSHAELHVLSTHTNIAFMKRQLYKFLLTITWIVLQTLTKLPLTMNKREKFVPASYLCMSKLRRDRMLAWALAYDTDKI